MYTIPCDQDFSISTKIFDHCDFWPSNLDVAIWGHPSSTEQILLCPDFICQTEDVLCFGNVYILYFEYILLYPVFLVTMWKKIAYKYNIVCFQWWCYRNNIKRFETSNWISFKVSILLYWNSLECYYTFMRLLYIA